MIRVDLDQERLSPALEMQPDPGNRRRPARATDPRASAARTARQWAWLARRARRSGCDSSRLGLAVTAGHFAGIARIDVNLGRNLSLLAARREQLFQILLVLAAQVVET